MRILKKLFFYATLIGVLLLSILVAFSFLYQNEIIQGFTQELNKQLKAPIHTSKIEFSLLENFPQGTVTLYNVAGMEASTYSSSADTLFKLEKFSFHFDVIQLWNSNFELQNVTAINGFCHLKVNKSGKANYDIVEATSSDTSTFLVALNKVKFKQVDFLYHDKTTRHKYHFFLESVTAKGLLSNSQVNVALFGSTKVTHLVIDNTSYIDGERATLDVGVEIDTEHGAFQVSRGFVTLRKKYKFDVKGKNSANGYDFTFKGVNLELEKIRELVPEKYMPLSRQYYFSGNAQVSVFLQKKRKQVNPKIEVVFDVKNGSFTNAKNDQNLEIPVLKGSLDMGRYANVVSASLHIKELNVLLNEGKVHGSVQLKNFKHPNYRIELGGQADLKKLSDVFAFDDFKMEGIANFNLDVNGALATLDSVSVSDIQKIRGKAKLDLNQVKLQIVQLPLIEVDSGSLLVDQQKAKLSGLMGRVDGAACRGWVWADNWLNYTMNPTNDLRIAGNVDLAFLKLANWQPAADSAATETPFAFAKHVYVDAVAKVQTLEIANNTLSNVAANIQLTPTQLGIQNIQAAVFDGRLAGDFYMGVYGKYIAYESNCSVASVNVTEILNTYHNFGQKIVTSKHLEGDLSFVGKVRFKSDRYMRINESSLFVDGDVVMVNGIIHENKLLTNIPKEIESDKILSIFINLSEFEKRLHHIKFDTVQNHITIANSVLTIPDMDIRSSALDINIRGTHSFANEMDYYMVFNLNEVLSKRKLDTDEYGFIEDDKLGRRLVYLHVFTVKDDIKVEVDKLGKKHRANKSLFGGGLNEAKGVLKQELGLFKGDTAVKKEVIPEPEFDYEVDFGEFDTAVSSSAESPKNDSLQKTQEEKSSVKKTGLKPKKKKTKEKEKKEFEEWEFDDDDY